MKAAAPLLLMALAGCAAVAGLSDPPLAQFTRWRDAPRAAVAAEPVVSPCPAANPACARLHALRAEACLGEALAARAPGAACPASRAAPLLDCAAEGYAAALAAGAAGAPTLRAGQAQALLCRAELDGPAAAVPRAKAASEAATGAPPELAALHGARAALLLARIGAHLSENRKVAPDPSGATPAEAGAHGGASLRAGDAGSRIRGNDSGDDAAPTQGSSATTGRAAADLSESRTPARAAGDLSERCEFSRRALDLSASAPAEHRARLRADALLLLRSCEAPAR